jgi:hypothetical protein
MSKPPKIERAQRSVIAALLCLVFVLGVLDRESLHAPLGSNHPAQATDQDSAPKTTYEPIKPSDWCLIALNFALVVSTVLLWRANNRSAKIAERALTELEGPFLSVNIKDPGIDWKNVGDIVFDELIFSFVNYGRTPALILEFREQITPNDVGAGVPTFMDPIKERGDIMPYGVVAPPNNQTQDFRTPVSVDFFEGAKYEPPTDPSPRVRGSEVMSDLLIFSVAFTCWDFPLSSIPAATDGF